MFLSVFFQIFWLYGPTTSDSWNSCHGDITVLLVVTVGLMVVSRVIGITVLHRALRDNGTYIRMCFVFLLCPTMSHSKIILTSVGRWSRKRCEKAVGRSIYYRLSYNYILIEATGISEEGFPRTCVFIISRNKSSPYVRIKNKDDTAFAHIVVNFRTSWSAQIIFGSRCILSFWCVSVGKDFLQHLNGYYRHVSHIHSKTRRGWRSWFLEAVDDGGESGWGHRRRLDFLSVVEYMKANDIVVRVFLPGYMDDDEEDEDESFEVISTTWVTMMTTRMMNTWIS